MTTYIRSRASDRWVPLKSHLRPASQWLLKSWCRTLSEQREVDPPIAQQQDEEKTKRRKTSEVTDMSAYYNIHDFVVTNNAYNLASFSSEDYKERRIHTNSAATHYSHTRRHSFAYGSPRKPKRHRLVAEQNSVNSRVQRGGSSFRSVLLHLFDGEPRLSTSVQVDLVSTLGGLSLPNVTGNVEGDDDRSGQVGL